MNVAVVIPCFRVTNHVTDVISRIGPEVSHIYAVDDACPDHSGRYIEQHVSDPRVKVVFRETNGGVGAATLTGYKAAMNDGAGVIVKIDGDGQMNPALIHRFVHPIVAGRCDYTKGNRFFDLKGVEQMPRTRLFGNAILSFITKFSTGYWGTFDPTNGYTAIHADVAKELSFDKISQRYFFETDMLFRLNIIRAVVQDVPMDAVYGNEVSQLKIGRVIPEFLAKHLSNFSKRIFYNYFLRDMSAASFELIGGVTLSAFGVIFGALTWMKSLQSHQLSSSGTVMLAALPVMIGIQLLIAFLNFDIASTPRVPIQGVLGRAGPETGTTTQSMPGPEPD
jgi:glycosyltransferase involved in cell wall biosynthesis